MPNWCNNRLRVIGSKENIAKYRHLFLLPKKNEHGQQFSFACAVPQPENLYKNPLNWKKEIELTEQGIPNWYNWNINNWGTKWNADCYDIEENYGGETDHMIFYFNTAWSPPTQWFYKLCDQIEAGDLILEMFFSEIGVSFAGTLVYDQDGNIVEYEGRITDVICDTDIQIKYNKHKGGWEDPDGNDVDDDYIGYEFDYGYEYYSL